MNVISGDNIANSMMTIDILKTILSNANNPLNLGNAITTQLRELIGVKNDSFSPIFKFRMYKI